MEIGSVLRESRLNSRMTVEQVSKILTKQGYKASQKTVYSWENGNSRPDIEILMKLCDIYGIKDILGTFGYDGYKEDGSLQLNMKEVDMVEKYRLISTHSPDGAVVVDTVLDREYAIAEKLREQSEQIQEKDSRITELENTLTDMSDYSYLNAAHDNGVTEEQKAAVDKIMMDDNEWE